MSINDLKTMAIVIFIILASMIAYKYTHLYLYLNIDGKPSLPKLVKYFDEEIENTYLIVMFQLCILLIAIPIMGTRSHLQFTTLFTLKSGAVAGIVYTLLDVIVKRRIMLKASKIMQQSDEKQTKYIKKLKLTKKGNF